MYKDKKREREQEVLEVTLHIQKGTLTKCQVTGQFKKED